MTFTNIDVSEKAPKFLGANCSQCPLFDCQIVLPWNIEHGEILFVGEAPGVQELLEGIPFVGQSGALLDKVIERVGHDPLRIAKTNACLCRPHRTSDGSITPPLDALEACSGAMEQVLSSFSGQTIVTLGATATAALDAFSDDDHSGGILSRRGVWHTAAINMTDNPDPKLQHITCVDGSIVDIKVLKYLPTLHPAFVLRSPGYIQKLIDDIDKAYQGAEKKHKFLETPYKLIEDFEALKSMIVELKSAPMISFDIETEYLQWYDTASKRGANVLCLVFAGTTDFAYIVPDTTLSQPRVLEFLQMFFDDREVLAHNGKFDVTVCKAKLDLNITLCDDTMLAHYTTTEGKGGHGLKELAQETFQIEDYEETILVPIFKELGMTKESRNYGKLPREILYKYAAIDAVVTLALYPILKERIEIEEQFEYPYRNVLMRASNALGIVELNGIPIDRPYLEKVLKVVTVDIEHLKSKLRQISQKSELNPASPLQVATVLYDDLKLRLHKQPIKPTSTNTGDECLKILLETYPTNEFITTLAEYRRVEKIRNTYVVPLLRIADKDDLVHVNFLLHGTETGRLSAGDSLHGIPRPSDKYGQMIRGAFIAPQGYKLVMCDYSQAELRCFADETQDPYLLDAYNKGLDVHNQTVQAMCKFMGIDYETLDKDGPQYKEIRTKAKNINFGTLVYLGGAKAVGAMAGLDPVLVQQVMDYNAPKLGVAQAWQKSQFRFAKRNGYVKNRFGRKRRFILQTSNNIDEIRKASVNAVIQGDASDLTLLSVCEMIESGIKVVHTVHDSIIALVPDELACNTAHHMQAIMERVGSKFFPSIPWSADVEISSSWYEKRPNLEDI
jgi:DNA polymerase-1